MEKYTEINAECAEYQAEYFFLKYTKKNAEIYRKTHKINTVDSR